MKALIIIVCLCFVTVSMAAQVDTNCPAMNESRVKNDKITSTVKSVTRNKASSAQ